MTKKKIIAIALFLLLSLFMFNYASPSEIEMQDEKLKIKEETKEEVKEETKEVATDNDSNNIYTETKEITLNVDDNTFVILLGESIDVLEGVEALPEGEVEVSVSITDTSTLEVGSHNIEYTAKDKNGNSKKSEKTIIVLDPNEDNDGDGFTNLEEMKETKEPTDPEKPLCEVEETNAQFLINDNILPIVIKNISDIDKVINNIVENNDECEENPYKDSEHTDPLDKEDHPETYAPKIILNGSNPYVMLKDSEYKEEGFELVLDPHDTITKESDAEITSTLDNTKKGEYNINYKITDRYGKSATDNRKVIVLDGKEDTDGDHYTNEEELANGSDPLDKDVTPDYDYAPRIDITTKTDSMIVYDEIPEISATAYDEYYGEIEVVISNNINKDEVGIYEIKYTATDILGNKTEEVEEFKVNKRAIDVTIDSKSSVYGNALLGLTYTTTGELEFNKAGISLTTTATNSSNVGEYPITGTYTNTNYDVTFIDGTYEITKKTLTEDDLGNISFGTTKFTYDGKEHKVELSNLPEGFTVDYENNTRTDAGEQTVTATITGTGNYEGTVTLTKELVIEQAKVTVIAEDKTSVYGAPLEKLTYKVTEGTVYGEDDLNITFDTIVTEGCDVGTYTINLAANNDNYDVDIYTGKYIITKKKLSEKDLANVSFGTSSFTYDGEEHIVTVNNLPEGFTVDYENNTRTNAGEQIVTATVIGNDNYEGTVKLTEKLVINKTKVTVVAEDKTSVYGESLKELTSKVEGTIYEEDSLNIKLSTTATANSSIGTYDISVTATNSNYDITLKNGTYTITNKILKSEDITWGATSFLYNGVEQKPTVTIKGLDGKLINLEVDVSEGSAVNAGTYNAIAKVPNNYAVELDANKITFEITKRNLTVTIDNKNSIYGSNIEKLTYLVTVGTELESNKAGISLTTTATNSSNVGKYPITGTYTNTNYNVTFTDGTYEITKKTLTSEDLANVSFGTTEFTYDGKEHKVELSNLPEGFTVAYKNNTRTNARDQTVTATITGTGNYEGTVELTEELVIEQAKVTVTAEDKTSVYGESLKELTYKVTEGTVYGEDNLNIKLSTTATDNSSIGTYDISVTATNSNYDITLKNGTYTIIKKTLIEDDLGNISFGKTEFTYDGEEHKVELTNLPEGFEVTYKDNGRTNVGSQTVTATITAKEDSNYSGSITKEITLTINPKTINVTWSNTSLEYTGKDLLPTYTYNSSDIVTGDIVNFTISGASSTVGTHTATLSIDNSNYVLNESTKEFNIGNAIVGIEVVEKPNVQFVFKKGTTVNMSELITVYEVYADGSKKETTAYTTDIDTSKVVDNKTLTITLDKFKDTSKKYKVIEEEAFQTKFEVIYVGNSFRETTYSYCTENCDSISNTKVMTSKYNVFEVIEHYDENIDLESAVLTYTDNTTLNLRISSSVRWSRYDDYALYDPVYILSNGYLYEPITDLIYDEDYVSDDDVVPKGKEVKVIAITYYRSGYGEYTIYFKKASDNTYKAYDEKKID